MASGKLLRKLVRSGIARDESEFRSAIEEVIRQERDKQHHLLANDLERILNGESVHDAESPATRALADSAPVDKERGLPLIDVRPPTRSVEDVVLDAQASEAIEDLVEEHRRSELLASFGLRPARRVLFHGPPGCGKTASAEAIAHELGLPFAVVRIDGVVSSFLGETARNLRSVFDFVSSNRMVALFDEFDAVGKARDDRSDHGEMHRVVNAFLQLFDGYAGESLLIAATNHEDLLDKAVWRRFDEAVYFPPPTPALLERFLASKTRGVRREFEPSDPNVLKLLEGKSYAVVERIVRRAVKDMVLRGAEFLTSETLERAEHREASFC